MSTTSPNRAARRHPETVPVRRYASVNDTAAYLAVTARTVRAMISDGRITAYRCGTRLVRIDLAEVDAVMTPFGGAVAADDAVLAMRQSPRGRLRQGQKK